VAITQLNLPVDAKPVPAENPASGSLPARQRAKVWNGLRAVQELQDSAARQWFTRRREPKAVAGEEYSSAQ